MNLSIKSFIACSLLATASGQNTVLDKFSPDGVGICKNGRYAGYQTQTHATKGWPDNTNEDVMTLENCAEICDTEEYCSYFSVDPGNYCTRYTNTRGVTEQFGNDPTVVGTCNYRWNNDWFDKHLVYKKISAYPDDAWGNFTYHGRGICSTGYYAGWSDDDDLEYMSAERCARICDSETQCQYFSVWETMACNRYTNVKWLAASRIIVGDCISTDPDNPIVLTYEKKQPTVSATTTGQENILDKFSPDGVGICKNGRYAGYQTGANTADHGFLDDYDYLKMTLESCAELCDSEEYCSYFSVDPGNYCTRFTNTPGIKDQLTGEKSVVGTCDLRQHNDWFDQHSVYKKISAYPDDAWGNFTYKGRGRCTTGYYAGWSDDDDLEYMSAERCARICDSEPQCAYFAIWETMSCMRYTNIRSLAANKMIAGECISTDPDNPIVLLYKKEKSLSQCYGPTGRIYGDPHIQTFGGLNYDCHGAGEFIAAKSDENEFAVHTRFEYIGEEQKGITIARGFAFKEGNVSDPTVSLTTRRDTELEKCVTTMKVNGVETSPIQSILDGPQIFHKEYPKFSVTYVGMLSGATIATRTVWSDVIGCWMSLDICVTDDMANNSNIVGLIGTPNGNDWMNPAGEKIDVPQNNEAALRFGTAYQYCVDNWGVTNESESLFTYNGIGESNFNYYNKFPHETFNNTIELLFQNASDEIKLACNDDVECIIDTLGASEEDARMLQETELILDQVKDNPLDVIDVPHPEPPPPIVLQTIASPFVGGDPHFKTWSGERYDFHGVCDLVLLKNPKFNDGLGMEIHIRSKRTRRQWAFISTAVVGLGNNSFEVSGRKDGNTFWVNGVEGDGKEEMMNIAGYPIVYRKIHLMQREYTIYLGKDEKIIVKTWNNFVRLDLVGLGFEDASGSLGLLGSFPEGKRLGRDGKKVVEDLDQFGQEWQVLPSDPQLFHALEGPQFPEICQLPTRMAVRRRLTELAGVSMEDAERACSGVVEGERSLCVFDVMVTRKEATANAYL